MTGRHIYSVGEINRYIRNMFAGDGILSAIFIRGEVSNCKYHSSGHIYFSLKDAKGAMSCVMFAGDRRGLPFRMKDGDKVVVGGRVDVYERDGRYQLYAKEIRLEGEGILYERFMKMKNELGELGMFDVSYKKPIPKYAMNIGVVTAPTGAAIRDIQNISHRRNPYVQVILYPALVQGEGAKDSIVEGIRVLDSLGLDCIIVGRGGGSLEDLWAFNEREVAEAIFACETPVISAVGHETDVTIADYVADLRAPTPSAAAELAVFDLGEFRKKLDRYADSLERLTSGRIRQDLRRAEWYEARLKASSPGARLNNEKFRQAQLTDRFDRAIRVKLQSASGRAERYPELLQRAMDEKIRGAKARRDDLGEWLERGAKGALARDEKRADLYLARLDSLNPVKQLTRGFSFVTEEDGHALTRVAQAKPGDRIRIYVTDGVIRSEVTGTERVNSEKQGPAEGAPAKNTENTHGE